MRRPTCLGRSASPRAITAVRSRSLVGITAVCRAEQLLGVRSRCRCGAKQFGGDRRLRGAKGVATACMATIIANARTGASQPNVLPSICPDCIATRTRSTRGTTIHSRLRRSRIAMPHAASISAVVSRGFNEDSEAA